MNIELAFALGVLIGSILTNIWKMIFSARGTLRVDHSNPEKDVYRIEIDNLDAISKKTHVVLTVDNNADLSQK